jgi:pimeloyl-ACP methyl ester carboxylesterase
MKKLIIISVLCFIGWLIYPKRQNSPTYSVSNRQEADSINSTIPQNKPAPYVVFVNGFSNCCANQMYPLKDRLKQMNAEIRDVPYSNFDSGGTSSLGDRDKKFLKDGADFINNQLDKNRPLILIGHSFGGDSILELLPKINRRIQLVAVIDPVRGGGVRGTLKELYIPNNVDYFFNRWQTNEMFPIDYKEEKLAKIRCNAKMCDQDIQDFYRNADGEIERAKCKEIEFCKDKQSIGHSDLPRDGWIQRVIGDKIQEQLAEFQP